MSLSEPPERTARSFAPCPLGLRSPRGIKAPRPFFLPKGFEFTADEEFRLEAAHRAERPAYEWNYVVRLPSGEFDRAPRAKRDNAGPNDFIQLVSQAWYLPEDLTVVEEPKA